MPGEQTVPISPSWGWLLVQPSLKKAAGESFPARIWLLLLQERPRQSQDGAHLFLKTHHSFSSQTYWTWKNSGFWTWKILGSQPIPVLWSRILLFLSIGPIDLNKKKKKPWFFKIIYPCSEICKTAWAKLSCWHSKYIYCQPACAKTKAQLLHIKSVNNLIKTEF